MKEQTKWLRMNIRQGIHQIEVFGIYNFYNWAFVFAPLHILVGKITQL